MKAYVVIIGLVLVSLSLRSTFLFNRSLLFHNSMLFAALPWICALPTGFHTTFHLKFHISGGLALILHAVQACVSTADIAQLLSMTLLLITENIMLTSNYSFPTACVCVCVRACVRACKRKSFTLSQPIQGFRGWWAALLTINKHLYIFPFRKTYLLTVNIFSICFPSDRGKRKGEARRRGENNPPQFLRHSRSVEQMEAGLFARMYMPTSHRYYMSVALSFGKLL